MNVQAEIITIGDEILIGQTVDTNSAWMGQELNLRGVDIDRIVSIRDTKEAIVHALDQVKPTTQLVLITGGLGPTKDDLTKHVLTEYFGGELIQNDEALENIHRLFNTIGLKVNAVNEAQALLPSTAKALINEVGTASGMHFEKNKCHYISMPGVPYEMKNIMKVHILPFIEEHLVSGHIVHKTLLTHGVPESVLAEMISNWEEELPNPLKLAYLPSPGMVKLRITAKGGDRGFLEASIAREALQLKKLIGNHIYGEDDDSLEKLVGRLLKDKRANLATAESCTGGHLAHRITSVPGSSAYFNGSVVAYDNAIKERVLGVSASSLEEYGAVSEAVVCQMAEGICKLMGTHYGLATSGVAGPDGGSEEKPVGTVWIAVAGPSGTVAKKFTFGKDRLRNIHRSSFMALSMLRQSLIENGKDLRD